MTDSSYRSWATCGLRSTVTTEDVKQVAPGVRLVSTTSLTLCALDPEKATVDMVVRNRVEGGGLSIPPTEILNEIEIPAHAPPGSEMMEPPGDDAPVAEGMETLTISGQAVPCRWTLREYQAGDRKVRFKSWNSELIPGGVARSEAEVEGHPELSSTTIVVSFLKK